MNKHLITIDDQTNNTPAPVQPVTVGENILIVGSFGRGRTNQLLQFYPGEGSRFQEEFGTPNLTKYGPGLDIGLKALANSRDLGVLAINVAPGDATMANAILVAKHKINKDVQATQDGNPLYLTPQGQETTVAAGNTPIVRDVLEYKLETVAATTIKSKLDAYSAVDVPYSTTVDASGFVTTPLLLFYYPGAGVFGNNLNFRMVDKVSRATGEVLYDMEFFNGSYTTTISDISLFPDSVAYAGLNLFIEQRLKSNPNIEVVVSSHYEDFLELYGEYAGSPKKIDLFDVGTQYKLVTSAGSLDVTKPLAVKFSAGTAGTASALNDQYIKFFQSKMITDLDSIIRYKISVIPDLGFAATVKTEIKNFLKRRTNTTRAFLMAGDSNSFESALTEMATNKAEDLATVAYYAAVQSPVRNDIYTKRALRFPNIYYTMCAYVDLYQKNGNTFSAFAGAGVRWTDFDEDSLVCPNDSMDETFTDSRLNVVKMDRLPGAYIANQDTNTVMLTDRTEINNMSITSGVLYDISDAVHQNGYKFNDIAEVESFQSKVRLEIYTKYSAWVSGINVVVAKKGLTGADKNTNLLKVTVNFKDLAKRTETILTITDNPVAQ